MNKIINKIFNFVPCTRPEEVAPNTTEYAPKKQHHTSP